MSNKNLHKASKAKKTKPQESRIKLKLPKFPKELQPQKSGEVIKRVI